MIPTITLQFSTTQSSLGNWASALIRRMTHSPFSHVDIVTPDGHLLGASDSPDAPVIEGNPRGVAIRPQHYQAFGYRRRMIIQTGKAPPIYQAAYSQIGKPFDGDALQDFISDSFPGYRDWRDTGHWFCAELAVWAFETGGYWLPMTELPWPKNRVSPSDLFLIFLMDANWLNRETFWDRIEGLSLDSKER